MILGTSVAGGDGDGGGGAEGGGGGDGGARIDGTSRETSSKGIASFAATAARIVAEPSVATCCERYTSRLTTTFTSSASTAEIAPVLATSGSVGRRAQRHLRHALDRRRHVALTRDVGAEGRLQRVFGVAALERLNNGRARATDRHLRHHAARADAHLDLRDIDAGFLREHAAEFFLVEVVGVLGENELDAGVGALHLHHLGDHILRRSRRPQTLPS